MTSKVHGLTPQQVNAVEMISAGASPAATAESLQVSAETVYKWQRSRPFQRALTDIIDARLLQAKRAGQSSVPRAIATIINIMNDPNNPPGIRLKAATDFLDRFKVGDHSASASRQAELEDAEQVSKATLQEILSERYRLQTERLVALKQADQLELMQENEDEVETELDYQDAEIVGGGEEQ